MNSHRTSKQVAKTLVVVALAIALLPAASYAREYTEEFLETYAIDSGGRLELENTNGNVEIVAWNGSEIEVRATKKASSGSRSRAEEALEDTRIEVDASSSRVSIDTRFPRSSNSFFSWIFGSSVNVSVHYVVSVPSDLDVEVKTVNGNVTVEAVAGRVGARSTNGGIRMVGVRGSAEAGTVNGRIVAEVVSLENDLSLSSTNGGIRVELPRGSGADLEARTVNGRVRIDHPIEITSENRRGSKKSGAINGGGAYLELKTVNGNIAVDRGATS